MRENSSYLRKLEAVVDQAWRVDAGDVVPLLGDARRHGAWERTFSGMHAALLAAAAGAVRAGTGLDPRRGQMVAALALLDGKVVEMPTGEGKTVVAALAAIMASAMGVPVHVMTANGYLARRDAAWMGRAYAVAGMTCGVIGGEGTREAMLADVTYGDARGFATVWLLSKTSLRKRLSPFPGRRGMAIVDEADKVLIDDAGTPVSVIGRPVSDTALWEAAWKVTASLSEDDYEAEKGPDTFVLSDSGARTVETAFGLDDLFTVVGSGILHAVTQCGRAMLFLERDNDYVVDGGGVVPVDPSTGRRSAGRFLNGMHQAIEAKEGLPISPEGHVVGTISMKNFLSGYKLLSGMSGTVAGDRDELSSVYGTGCVVVPPHAPSRRIDHPDLVFATVDDKLRHAAGLVRKTAVSGRPVLVGCENPSQAEALSGLLRDVPHDVLDAKHPEGEADIVLGAGQAGKVTITANMAGRGTDIVLGDGVSGKGGLLVIGASRHRARRLDDQLRGRAGRQGDPGETVFLVSLEDDLMSALGADAVKPLASRLGEKAKDGIESKMVSSAIRSAQRRLETAAEAARKGVRERDDAIDRQRGIVFALRDRVLDGAESIREILDGMVVELAEMDSSGPEDKARLADPGRMRSNLDEAFSQVSGAIGNEAEEVFRQVVLHIIDVHWEALVAEMDRMAQNAHARSHASRDIRLDMKKEAFAMFREMYSSMLSACVSRCGKVRVELRPAPVLSGEGAGS